MNHIMVDLETLSTKQRAQIIGIGAVQFDLKGNTGKTFHRNILVDFRNNFHVDDGTIRWWLTKSSKARKALNDPPPISLSKVLSDFHQFLNLCGDITRLQLWGNGVKFDLGILSNAYETDTGFIPWDHRRELDVRTIVSASPSFKKDHKFTGINHSPVDDCYNQIQYLIQTLNYLGITNFYSN